VEPGVGPGLKSSLSPFGDDGAWGDGRSGSDRFRSATDPYTHLAFSTAKVSNKVSNATCV
jgi:hypothetical protein